MTNFITTYEQRELRSSLRRLLTSKSDSARVRRHMQTPAGNDPELWDILAGQLGLHALAIPEEYGGLGLGYAELCVVLSELGRFLAVTPFLASVAVAAPALLCSGDTDAMKTYLPRLASGEWVATLAVAGGGASAHADDAGVNCVAVRAAGGWLVSGIREIVLEGMAADLLLVPARSDQGLSLFAVEATAPGVTRAPLSVLDLTRKQARIELGHAPATLIGPEGQAGDRLRTALDLAAVALAAEQVGGAERCLEMATEYAGTRFQFGRPIGSYQAISHKCADMLVQVEMARSAARYAAAVADADRSGDGGRELALASSIAKAFCSDAYMFAASENIQIHGGIGVTWEHDAHLYFKRAKSSLMMFGDPIAHRARIAELLAL